jgi:hypothetical protein
LTKLSVSISRQLGRCESGPLTACKNRRFI